MLSSVAESWSEGSLPPRGITVEVLVAAICFCVSAAAAAVAGTTTDHPGAFALVAGWPVAALVGGVLLDQRPTTAPGRVLLAESLVPALVLGWGAARSGGSTQVDLVAAFVELAAVVVAGTAIALPCSFHAPPHPRAAFLLTLTAALGAIAVLLAEGGALPATVRVAGWILVGLGCVGIWTLVAAASRAHRSTRRRTSWLLVSLSVAGLTIGTAWWLGSLGVASFVTGSAVVLGAVVVGRLWLSTGFRPLDEPLLDLLLLAAVVGATLLMALLVRLGASTLRLPSAGTSAAFTALVTASMAVPGALWVRRTALSRRYGTGVLSPADVAVITADLHAQTEPRDLLDKAARMVAAASASREARIVLGDDAPAVPASWVVHHLDVGGDRVGALAVDSGDAEGPEPRQQKVVAQLLPTVALVARAVGLAVEAEHARRDVARQRDAERTRVLGDLHDGLGPVLAGMSMRVQASLRTSPPPEYAALFRDLADGLATSRTDLRRIVAGITPSILDDGDLASALERLVASFQGVGGGPQVTLRVSLDGPVSPAVQVAVYRSVAEALTNALRHARASEVAVSVESRAGLVVVGVVDDGSGGPVVPGVGLSSLAQRAEHLGGCLELGAADPAGTRLHLRLPAVQEATP